MAEDLMSEGPGDGDQKPSADSPEVLAAARALAAAIAAVAALHDLRVAHDASRFLQSNSRLLDIQAKQLEDDRESSLRRFGNRLQIAFRLAVAVLATIVVLAALAFVHDAFISNSVVIHPFESPPALAANGLNGKVIASQFLDVLTQIQAQTRSNAKSRSLSNAWTHEIAIQVPDTGVSIGQLQQILKASFAHETHIGGDVVLTEKAELSLTVRGIGIIPKTFPGTDARHLDSVLRQAAEYVYGQSQPGLWAAHLSNNNRNDEAIRFAQSAFAAAASTERPYLLNYWANAIISKGTQGAMGDALPLYWKAVSLNAEFWIGYNNIMNALTNMGQEEGAVHVGEQLLKYAHGRPGRAPEDTYENYDSAVWDLSAERAEQITDMESHQGVGTTTLVSGSENLVVAQIEVQMHDVAAATIRLKTIRVDKENTADVAQAALDQALLDEETGDFKAAAREWDIFVDAYGNPIVSTNNPSDICFSAPTYERTGQSGKADAALEHVGDLTFVDCYRFKGDVLETRGDWAGAQTWYENATKLAPSIPSGYYSWGLALARHGDLDGAAAKFKEANQKGPHWAEPLKAWGDVLAKQGKAREAQGKYNEALKYAPN